MKAITICLGLALAACQGVEALPPASDTLRPRERPTVAPCPALEGVKWWLWSGLKEAVCK